MRLKDKVAIITGGGTGIGQGIALAFSKEGAKVAVVGRRKEMLDKTVLEISAKGGEALAIQADIAKAYDIVHMVSQVIERFGQVNVLVNNAGVYVSNDALMATEQEWDNVMDIDLKGTWLCAKAVLPHMIAQKSGKIINISSIAGLMGFAGSAVYCAAKGAVVNLTREMALDYIAKGILVNAIAPGLIVTDMTKPFLADAAAKNAFLKEIPAGRAGEPSDIAHLAVYLASGESDYVVGQTFVVDGGWTIH